MKKLFNIAVLMVTLTGCTSNSFIGEEYQPQQLTPVLFDGAHSNVTRNDATGASAASLLDNEFRVYGTYTQNGTKTVDFDNYRIIYDGTNVTDTTSGWTYVGLQSLGTNPVTQNVKYWNSDADDYNFIAFSGLAESTIITDDSQNTFHLDETNIDKVYASDRVTTKYDAPDTTAIAVLMGNNVVTMQFQHLSAHLRIGFYETVSGYAVSNLHFYYGDNYDGGLGTSSKTVAALQGVFPVSGNYTISYDENNKLQLAGNDYDTTDHFQFGELDYTTAESDSIAGYYLKADGSIDKEGDKVFLGTTSSSVTYACQDATINGHVSKNSDWQVIMPYPENAEDLVLRADFDLVPLNGSKAILHVRNAQAVVDVKKAQWKPNYAYTYIFKISDNCQEIATILLESAFSSKEETIK